jgi:hypothetical protein
MERVLKVYVNMYTRKEIEAPLFHNGPCKSIYSTSTEGKFVSEMEKGSEGFMVLEIPMIPSSSSLIPSI